MLSVPASEVREGDVVMEHAWHGGGPVLRVSDSGPYVRVEYDAPVVNPPAVIYLSAHSPLTVRRGGTRTGRMKCSEPNLSQV